MGFLFVLLHLNKLCFMIVLKEKMCSCLLQKITSCAVTVSTKSVSSLLIMEQLMDMFRGHVINSLSSTVSHFLREAVFNVLKCPQDFDTLMLFYAGFFLL